jgi:hypothetical protein
MDSFSISPFPHTLYMVEGGRRSRSGLFDLSGRKRGMGRGWWHIASGQSTGIPGLEEDMGRYTSVKHPPEF